MSPFVQPQGPGWMRSGECVGTIAFEAVPFPLRCGVVGAIRPGGVFERDEVA